MSANSFNFSLVLRADVASAKAALTDVSTGMRQMTAEAGAAGTASAKQAGNLERLAASAVKAISAQEGLVAAEKRVADARSRALILPMAAQASNTAPILAALKATETSAASLQGAVAGLSVTIGTQAQDMMAGAAASRAWQAALDDVRASFNPLFSASRQYEAQIERITEAERIGAITAREAAAARETAAGRMAPMVAGPGRSAVANNFHSANIGAQGFDIGVTAAMGMNPLTIGLQQGSQLVQVMQQMGGGMTAVKGVATGLLSIVSPASLATIALVAFGAAGIQALMKLKKETKTFDQNVGDLTTTLGRMKTSLELVQNVRLGDTFGSLTDDVKGLAQGMLELDRASELKQMKSVMDTFLGKEINQGWGQRIWGGIGAGAVPIPGMSVDDLVKNTPAREKNYKALGAANTYDDFTSRIDEIGKLAEAGDIDAVIAKLLELQKAMSGGGAASGMKKELRELLSGLGASAIEIAKVNAAWDGSAREKVTTRQTDQMVMAYKQQAELAATETQFGKSSLQVDQLRNVQAREMLDVRLEEQGILVGSANWHRIMIALADQESAAAKQAAEEKRKQVAAVALGYRQEAELSAAARQFGQDSFAVEVIRARQSRDALEIRLEEMGVVKGSAEWQKAYNALLGQQVQRELDIAEAKKEAVRDQLDKLDGIRREIGLIGASNAEQSRSNALAEADIDIRKRKLTGLEAVLERMRRMAAANAEIERDRQKALYDIQGQTRMDAFDGAIARERNPQARAALEAEKEYARQIAAGADATVAAAAAEQVRARALDGLSRSQQDYIRGQREQMQQLQLELALVGQTEAVRARVLALAQAERDIQAQGATGVVAAEMRRNAEAQAEMTLFRDAQRDAWSRVTSAGESAIDTVLDKLRDGDVKGAMSDFVGEIEKGFFDLAIRNPLKNALFGSNLGTLDDVGGLGGIFDRLTGKSPVDEAALVSRATMPVASMSVNAATVMIGGIGLQSFLSQSAGPGGAMSGFGGGSTSLGGSADVQTQVWGFFAAKGLAPHMIAAIMGNASVESAFNPFAVGDAGTSFGLFQHHAGRGQNLLGAVGGQAGLGNVTAQLEFVWQELLTGENGVLKKLMSSNNLFDATKAFVGFERPQGYSANNPQNSMHWDRRLASAEAAMQKFEGQVYATNQGVVALGNGTAQVGQGLQGFGSSLQGLITGIGAQRGPLGQFAGGLLSWAVSKIPGFDAGGWTGPAADNAVAGVVHGGEFVFDAPTTRKIGVANLEAIRRGSMPGYRDGGYVTGGLPPSFVASTGGSGGSGGQAAPTKLVAEISVSGTGNAEIQQGVHAAIAQAFDFFGREVMPGQVKAIVNDRWGS